MVLYIIYTLLTVFSQQTKHIIPIGQSYEGIDGRIPMKENINDSILELQYKYDQWMELETYKTAHSNSILEEVKKNPIVKDVLKPDDIRGFQMNSGGLWDDWNRDT